jgi:hypothetical protein
MLSTLRQLRVFLCHASQDKSIALELQQRLVNKGWIDPWLDEKKLLPGDDWQTAIKKAIEQADLIVICLSNNSVNKEGFIQKELRYAQEIALEKPKGTIFLIPLRLDNCDVPRDLKPYQYTDYFGEKKEQNYSGFLESLNIRYQQIIRREGEKAKLDVIIWAHSDQDGGTEIACVIAKTFVEVSKVKVGIVTPKPDSARNFFTDGGDEKRLYVIPSPQLLRIAKRDGGVDADFTLDLLLKEPFVQETESETFPQLMAVIDDLKKNLIAPRIHDRTLMISTGEPIAVEIASQLKIKCVIVSDHILTASIRLLLRNSGLFDKKMARLFTVFEEFDRKADKAFLSPVEFAGSDYETYLGQGSIDCNFTGGLFYEPISKTNLNINDAYLTLKDAADNHDVVFVFGGGGKVWFDLYADLHKLVLEDKQLRGFALLVPSMIKDDKGENVRERDRETDKFLYTLYLPKGNSIEKIKLEDPGRLMYWYAACRLVVARGGLAAQQVLATMMSDAKNHPEMLFVEEPGHTQIEHERQSLYNLGFVHTRTLNSFRIDPIGVIQEVLSQIRPNETRAKVKVRYGKEMMKELINCLIELYLTRVDKNIP